MAGSAPLSEACLAKPSPAAEPEPDAEPEPAPVLDADPEASWQRFRDETKSIFKESFNEWVDEQDGALGDGEGTGGPGAGRASRGGDDPAPARTPAPAAGKGAAKPSGGLLTDLGLVVFGKPKTRK